MDDRVAALPTRRSPSSGPLRSPPLPPGDAALLPASRRAGLPGGSGAGPAVGGEASRCWRSSEVRAPAAGTSLRPYWMASGAPSGAWSAAKTKAGRCGMTSAKPAARWKLRVKDRMLLTPPRSVSAVSRFVMEDLRASCQHRHRLAAVGTGGESVVLPPAPQGGPFLVVVISLEEGFPGLVFVECDAPRGGRGDAAAPEGRVAAVGVAPRRRGSRGHGYRRNASQGALAAASGGLVAGAGRCGRPELPRCDINSGGPEESSSPRAGYLRDEVDLLPGTCHRPTRRKERSREPPG